MKGKASGEKLLKHFPFASKGLVGQSCRETKSRKCEVGSAKLQWQLVWTLYVQKLSC